MKIDLTKTAFVKFSDTRSTSKGTTLVRIDPTGNGMVTLRGVRINAPENFGYYTQVNEELNPSYVKNTLLKGGFKTMEHKEFSDIMGRLDKAIQKCNAITASTESKTESLYDKIKDIQKQSHQKKQAIWTKAAEEIQALV